MLAKAHPLLGRARPVFGYHQTYLMRQAKEVIESKIIPCERCGPDHSGPSSRVALPSAPMTTEEVFKSVGALHGRVTRELIVRRQQNWDKRHSKIKKPGTGKE
jgi:hypothetical protein